VNSGGAKIQQTFFYVVVILFFKYAGVQQSRIYSILKSFDTAVMDEIAELDQLE